MNTVNTEHLLQSSYASLLRASIGLTIVGLGLCGFLYIAKFLIIYHNRSYGILNRF